MQFAEEAALVTTAEVMMTTITATTIPATDTPIDALPSCLALPGFDTAMLHATTAHTCEYIPHTMMLYTVLHPSEILFMPCFVFICFFLFFGSSTQKGMEKFTKVIERCSLRHSILSGFDCASDINQDLNL